MLFRSDGSDICRVRCRYRNTVGYNDRYAGVSDQTIIYRSNHVRFRNRIAPSRHSGLSSLSPKDPSSSLTRISTFSGISRVRMSPKSSFTLSSPHSVACRSCRLYSRRQRGKGAEERGPAYVTKAFLFFSTAYTNAFLLARCIASRDRATSGPRPAPATQISLLEVSYTLNLQDSRYSYMRSALGQSINAWYIA